MSTQHDRPTPQHTNRSRNDQWPTHMQNEMERVAAPPRGFRDDEVRQENQKLKKQEADRKKRNNLIGFGLAGLTATGLVAWAAVDFVNEDRPEPQASAPAVPGETAPSDDELPEPTEVTPTLEQIELDREKYEALPVDTLEFSMPLKEMTSEEISYRAGYWDENADGVIMSSSLYARSILNILVDNDPTKIDVDHLIDQLSVEHFTDDPDSEVATKLREYAKTTYAEQEALALEQEGLAPGDQLEQKIDFNFGVCQTIEHEATLYNPACSPELGSSTWGDDARPSTVVFGTNEGNIDEIADVNITFIASNYNLDGAIDDLELQSQAHINFPNTTLRLDEENGHLLFVDK